MKNMGDYHDHYLKKDVLVLAEVFEELIDTRLKFFELDPCDHFSSPGLSWDAILKMNDVKLEKILDFDMYLFIEKGLREEFLTLLADTVKQTANTWKITILQNRQMNFEYGIFIWIILAMSGHVPYGGFKLLRNVDKFDVNSISEKSPIGYILENDLEYPDELHVLHNDYPLALEKLAIPYDMLSDYCKKITDEYEIKVGDVKKLIPNLGGKTNYVLHYRNL